jgi:3-hydroxyacyl-[acyl-carrier-protein] dehydratase
MDHELKLQAPLDHSSYVGHFPGHPIVPGVLLLELVCEAIAGGPPRVIANVKFHRAVKPGEFFTVRYELVGPQLAFRCQDGEQLLAEGSLMLDAGPGAVA